MGLTVDGLHVAAVHAPANYRLLLHDVLPRLHWQLVDDVAVLAASSQDVIHLFAADRQRLCEALPHALSALMPGGVLWISWPKKSSAEFRDLTDNEVRAVVLPTGWVDVKVVAIDETWSGLKFLRRRKAGA